MPRRVPHVSAQPIARTRSSHLSTNMATSGAGTGAGAGSEAPAAASGPQKVIIDTDPGVDDTMALLLALACPEKADVVGITICMGNHNDMGTWMRNSAPQRHLCGQS